MKRRTFFSAGGLGGYSLFVRAEPSQETDVNSIRKAMDSVSPPTLARGGLAREPHMTLVDLSADLLVAGGGISGVCAAITAARHGAKVILVQDRSRLGGNSSSEVKMHIVGASCHKGRPGWREGGLIEELRLDDAANNPQRCWEMWDLLLYDKVVSEPNITLLLESTLYAAETKNGRITEVMVRCDKSEQLYRIKAKMFVDATGDSRLGLEAGAEMREGRESRSEFNESLAPEKADKETLGSSILFTSRLHPRAMPFTAPKWARKVTKETLRFRGVRSWEYGYWWIAWGGDKDIIRDNERIRFELLAITVGVWDYIKNSGEHPTAANYALDWVGMMPGKRASRRLVGDYILKQADLERSTLFPDGVAIGGWPMDDHPPGGFDRADIPPNTSIRTKEVFSIPLRCLYSRNVENLFLAGRNISTSHVAFTSTRVMATCAVVGQAAGAAAAMCLERGLNPRGLANNPALVTSLRQRLLRDDQSIQGVRNEDPKDVARQAKVTASAEQGEKKAVLILDGVTRDIPERKEVHHWEAPLGAGGSWIELGWEKPRRIGEVQISFDSGFERELTLTSSDGINRGIIRAPQPETVKDYVVEFRGPKAPPPITVKGNHQRLNRHRFEAGEVEAVRIRVLSTNGLEAARIFEVRCYA